MKPGWDLKNTEAALQNLSAASVCLAQACEGTHLEPYNDFWRTGSIFSP